MDEKDIQEKRKELVEKVKTFFSSNDSDTNITDEDSSSKEMLEKRKELIKFVKEKKQWIVYIVLAGIIWFSSYIRTRNLNLLKDVTTGKYIPLALDPHLFLKYARYIVENGALLAHDPTRFVPLGTSTSGYVFMSSFIAYLYKFLSVFSPGITLEYVDVIYPVITFAGAMLFFFLLIKKLFDWKVGLLATLFLSIVPAFLHRTMAGFSDHEALGVLLMFMAMYFYVLGWESKTTTKTLFWSAGAGIFTGLMGLSWGGWKFLILIISLFTLVELFLSKLKKIDIYQYLIWVVTFFLTVTIWIPMFSVEKLISSFTTGIAFLVFFMLVIDLFLFKFDILKIKNKFHKKMPLSVVSLVSSLVLGLVILTIFLGPGTMLLHLNEVSDNLLHPLGNDRWQLTVAEQHQPYFTDWASQFGPKWFNVPLYLTLFLMGSVILFYNMVKDNKKKLLITLTYLTFILAFILSRHSPGSLFNGTNFISKLVYLGSLVLFIGLGIYFYFNSYYKNKEEYNTVLAWDKKYIFIFVWFLIMVIAARGAARLMFIFAPITAVMAGYAVVELGKYITKIKEKTYLLIALVILLLVLISPFAFPAKGIIPTFSEISLNQGKYSGPSYNQQWQVAGQWVKDNIPENAVFGHWWDYGYWVQNGFERASVLDGANKIKYWNYLMGRNVLTARTQKEALEFLKVHDTTHYLIVSDEIGKYTAYSSIGSDKNYDRYSWITTFMLNPKLSKETRNATLLFYQGGYVLDDDFVWNNVVYPSQQAGIGAVLLPVRQVESKVGNETSVELIFEQPTVALVYRNQRTDVPLECIYFNGKMIKFEKEGYKGCFRITPTLNSQGQLENPMGGGMLVSEKGVKALWVNLYVFEQNNPDYDTSAFKPVYDDKYISISAIYQGRLVGPIKIWEIEYPDNFTVDEETKKKYLGGNELLPDYFYDVN